MSSILSSEDFGKKLYQTLPPIYREDDSKVNFALKRYLEALADGGFAKVIDEINNLMTLVDPNKIPSELLPILYHSYGLDIFHGIPENYLRKLLPMVSKLFSYKGTTTAIEYLTNVVSGIKTSMTTSGTNSYFETGDPFGVAVFNSSENNIDVTLDLDFDATTNRGFEMPDREQLLRIVKEFLPFFCDVTIIYAYFFSETFNIEMEDVCEELINFLSEEVGNSEVKEDCESVLREATGDTINISRYGVPNSTSIFNTGAPFSVMKFNRLPTLLSEEHIDYIHTSLIEEKNSSTLYEKFGGDKLVIKNADHEELKSEVKDKSSNSVSIINKEVMSISRSILNDLLSVSQCFNTKKDISVRESCVSHITQPPKDYAVFNKNTFGECLFGNNTKEVISVTF